jgi:hypothetical protein
LLREVYMRIPIRFVLATVVFTICYLWMYWVPYFLFPGAPGPQWLTQLVSLGASVLIAWSVWRRSQRSTSALVLRIVRSAALAYIIGFAAGVLSGPVLFPTKPNQGLLFGFFFTAPAGAVIGMIAAVVSSRRAKLRDSHTA